MTAIALNTSQRSALRGLAHALPVTVHIGQGGLSPAVLKEVDAALAAHGLIKVRVLAAEREERAQMLEQLAQALFCAAVQHIGRILVLWRARPQDVVSLGVSAAQPGSATGRRRLAVKVAPRAAAGTAARPASTRSRGEAFEERVRRPRSSAADTAAPKRGNRPPRDARSVDADGYAHARPRSATSLRSTGGAGGPRRAAPAGRPAKPGRPRKPTRD